MRIVFGVLSLLVAVAIVGVLAKKQLGAVSGSSPATAATSAGVTVPTGAPKQQVDQVKQAVENAMQQARPVDDTK
jgi:Na+-transporting methylmalonyl-CoA/oxaloacetate decarboxylase gamma subunit